MDTEEWEDLIEAHAWYNGAGSNDEKAAKGRNFTDGLADK